AGTASVTATVCALLAPLLAKVNVYVMLLPAMTGSGASLFVTDRSASVVTVVVVVPVLLPGVGSLVTDAAVAVLVIAAPAGVLAFTFTTIEKTADSPAATVPFEKTIFPVPPTAGLVILQPL